MLLQPEIPPFIPFKGPSGIGLSDAAHIMVLGSGRSADGIGLSEASRERTSHGAEYFAFADMVGNFVCNGYKTPADKTMQPWIEQQTGERLKGRPEADGMNEWLDLAEPELHIKYGRAVPTDRRRIERHSTDSVTNFTRTEAEKHFGDADERPVIITGHEDHLDRVFQRRGIARRTLRRDFVGLIVPGAPDAPTNANVASTVFSQIILGRASTKRSPQKNLENTIKNSERAWSALLFIRSLKSRN